MTAEQVAIVIVVFVIAAVGTDLALAAAVRSTETRSRLGPQGRQSGPKGNARKRAA